MCRFPSGQMLGHSLGNRLTCPFLQVYERAGGVDFEEHVLPVRRQSKINAAVFQSQLRHKRVNPCRQLVRKFMGAAGDLSHLHPIIQTVHLLDVKLRSNEPVTYCRYSNIADARHHYLDGDWRVTKVMKQGQIFFSQNACGAPNQAALVKSFVDDITIVVITKFDYCVRIIRDQCIGHGEAKFTGDLQLVRLVFGGGIALDIVYPKRVAALKQAVKRADAFLMRKASHRRVVNARVDVDWLRAAPPEAGDILQRNLPPVLSEHQEVFRAVSKPPGQRYRAWKL